MNNKTKHKSGIAVFFVFAVLLIAAAAVLHILISGALQDSGKAPSVRNEVRKSALAAEPEPTASAALPDTSEAPEAAWNLLLVNPWNELPEGFSVELRELGDGEAVDERAYPDLQAMLDDARAEGLSPIVCSSYRTREKQQELFTRRVGRLTAAGYSEQEAVTEAGKWVAVPGTSEHQTGLALDIISSSYQVLDRDQENTAEQRWLMENSYKYGFILRYPSDKSEITGINYEPWHYRYVGKEAAKEIYEKGLCLEEYLEYLSLEDTAKSRINACTDGGAGV